jgi:pimeloyl-ACP methyl ester carboxylesterase
MILAHELAGDGDAPAIVLVHGITESRETWRPLIGPLARDHRVLAVDLRGHGASGHEAPYDPAQYAADVAETIDSAGLADPLLVGHSLGGVIVTAVPAARDDVVGIVNVDQPLALGGFRAALQQLEPALRGTPAEFAGAIDAVFDSMVGPLTPDERARIDAIRAPDQDVVLGTWALVLEAPEEELAAGVDALAAAAGDRPYLSLHGIAPGPDYAEWLQARIPRAVVEVWPDHGHYPFLVDRARFLERVGAFEEAVRS